MELRRLRYFVHVAEELHFGRAAARLGMSQPPLSQQIGLLERELGVALFDRTSRRVRLTEAGRLFLPEALRAVQQADHAFLTARRAQRGEVGKLEIGHSSSAPFVPVVANALFRFRETYSDVQLHLSELSRDDQIAQLRERRLDCGMVRGIDPLLLPADLVATMLLEEPLLVAMRRDHPMMQCPGPLTIARLRDEPFVLYETHRGAGFNEHLYALCRNAGFAPQVVQEASGLATLLGLVAAGFGLTVLSHSLATLHIDQLCYRRIEQADAVSRLWLVHPRDMTPACTNFVDIIAGR